MFGTPETSTHSSTCKENINVKKTIDERQLRRLLDAIPLNSAEEELVRASRFRDPSIDVIVDCEDEESCDKIFISSKRLLTQRNEKPNFGETFNPGPSKKTKIGDSQESLKVKTKNRKLTNGIDSDDIIFEKLEFCLTPDKRVNNIFSAITTGEDAITQTSFDESLINNNRFLNISQASLRATDTKIPNILEVLSDDVTVSNGRKLFKNIVKIGTAEWLESALYLAYHATIKKDKKDEAEIMQVYNDYNMYIDNATKVAFECSNIGNVKICKITKKKTDMQEVNKTKINAKIHEIISQVYEAFENNKMPCLVMPSDTGRTKSAVKKLRFLVQTCRSKFCRILYLLGKIYFMLEHDVKLTKRDIFFQIKPFVSNQGQVNSDIDEITRLLGVGYWDLNIIVQSGLVYGNLKICWSSGDTINCNTKNTFIPEDLDNIVEIHSNANFILVVEKESTFHKFLRENLPNKLGRRFIMLTGKGMPDMNTRRFLKKISTMLSLPVFILVDADLYGIRILLNYKFGALSNTHLVDHLAVPNARWLGVFPSDFEKYNIPIQQMSRREIQDVESLLKTRRLEEDPNILREVNCLLSSKRKASIEDFFVSINNFLSDIFQ